MPFATVALSDSWPGYNQILMGAKRKALVAVIKKAQPTPTAPKPAEDTKHADAILASVQ
jgi:hypothetical protein